MNQKKYISLTLLVLISFKILVVPFVYLDFELRKDYIVKHLCENRFKPELHCDGQCYLAKTLTKIAEEKATNEAEKQGQNIKKVLEEVFEEQPVTLASSHFFTPKKATLFHYQSLSTSDFMDTLLRPPASIFS